MLISATYICPIRGLATLAPPEPLRLGQAARVAKDLELDQLMLPILEESLMGTVPSRVAFLDGLIKSMDQVFDAGLRVWLIAPAQRILGLDWVAPHLARGVRDPRAKPVFVDRKVRNLRPFDWWAEPGYVQLRVKLFRELAGALQGHPALTGWVILDRALEWARPDPQPADFVLRSYLAEIRERGETATVYLGLGWSEFQNPEMAQSLAGLVDGLRISGPEAWPTGLVRPETLPEQALLPAYLGSIGKWLFERPIAVEAGWECLNMDPDPDDLAEAGLHTARQGFEGVGWLSLVDPDRRLQNEPPWALKSGLEQSGLLDRDLWPKNFVEPWIQKIRSAKSKEDVNDYIDIEMDDYLDDPAMHFVRLWEHFRESNW
ncbi:hypothetical protein ACFL9T_20575 [Thermodesulfobacteriota bacterium]